MTQGIGEQCHKQKGSEQGDPLMPLLFSIGIHGALEEVSGSLEVGELLCAFLDDTYFLCEPDRVRPLFDLLAEALMRHAGIQLHQGKTRVWNRSGTLLVDVNTLGDEVWRFGWDQSVRHSIGQPRVRDAPDGGTAGRGTTPLGGNPTRA